MFSDLHALSLHSKLTRLGLVWQLHIVTAQLLLLFPLLRVLPGLMVQDALTSHPHSSQWEQERGKGLALPLRYNLEVVHIA